MQQPVKVVVEHDLAKSIMEILKLEDKRRVMIVLDQFLMSVPAVQEMIAEIQKNSIEVTIYGDIVPDPPASVINKGAEAMKNFGADCVIAIDGGSCLDSAKGIDIVASNGDSRDILDYVDETTREKNAILSDRILSDYALLIPELTLSLPKRQTIASGLDVFSHAAEGYLSNLSSPMADAISEKVMFLCANYLPKAVAEGQSIEYRERMMVAANLAGWILNQSGTIVGHSEAHILGSKYHFVHDEAVAYALPSVLEMSASVLPKKVKEIGKILGAEFTGDETPAEIGAITKQAYLKFRDEQVGLHPFSDYGVSNEELVKNADEVLHERFAGNTSFELTKENVTELLKHFG